jgi:poly(3-hydroxybutyrate) depolymerase
MPVGPEGWEASGRRNRDFDTAVVLWDFFRTHRLVP